MALCCQQFFGVSRTPGQKTPSNSSGALLKCLRLLWTGHLRWNAGTDAGVVLRRENAPGGGFLYTGQEDSWALTFLSTEQRRSRYRQPATG